MGIDEHDLEEYESEAFKRGFDEAKRQALVIMDEWSRSCHPTHRANMRGPLKDRCWQHHGLRAAIRDAKANMKPEGLKR